MSRSHPTISSVNVHIPRARFFRIAPRYTPQRMGTTKQNASAARLGTFPRVARVEDVDLDLQNEYLTTLETNIDDLSPQIIAYAMEELMSAGGLDVWAIPVQMKKGRLGTMLGVLCRASQVKPLIRIMLQETTSLGVRVQSCERISMQRDLETDTTLRGLPVRVKVGQFDGKIANVQPEYEDCAKIARESGVPLKQVLREALDAYFTRHPDS